MFAVVHNFCQLINLTSQVIYFLAMSLTSESFISERAQVSLGKKDKTEKLFSRNFIHGCTKPYGVVCVYLIDSITSGVVGALLACRGVAFGDPHLLHSLTVSCHRHAGGSCH